MLLPDETDSPEFVQAATELERASEEGGGIGVLLALIGTVSSVGTLGLARFT